MNKLIRTIILSFTAIALLFAAGCTEDFEEINTNPNQPSKANPSYLMTNAQFQIMDNYWDEWLNGRCGLLWSQYWSQNEYTEESRYRARPTTDDNYWGGFYAPLNDLQEIIRTNRNSENPNNNMMAAAMVLKSWTFQVLTDVYGHVPYYEALQGTENLQPAFDSQEQIYHALDSTLAAAVGMFEEDVPASKQIKGDNIYGGDVNKWKKFANSLRIRIATRMKDVAPSEAQSIYDAVMDDDNLKVFTSNADNATFVWGGSVPNANPLYEDHLTRTDFSVSNTMVQKLKSYNDPRLSVYASTNADGEYVGMPYGLDRGNAQSISNSEVSQPGEAVYSPTAPSILMTYDEVLFAKSEFNSWDQNAYENAVRASMKFWGVSQGDIDTYVNNLPSASRTEVLTQKWIALYMQGIQGWAHVRRTNVPNLDAPTDGIYESVAYMSPGTDVPTRRPYPAVLADLNNQNLQSALEAQGGNDKLNNPMWWDQDAE